MTLNPKQKLQNLTGETLKDESGLEMEIGETLSFLLARSEKSSNPWKAFKLAKDLKGDKPLELTPEDIVFIKESIKDNVYFTVMVTGQLLGILDGETL